jgi:hypothetical protein
MPSEESRKPFGCLEELNLSFNMVDEEEALLYPV